MFTIEKVQTQLIYKNEWFERIEYAKDAVKRYSGLQGFEIRKNEKGVYEFKSIKKQCDDLYVEVTQNDEKVIVTIWQD